MDIICDSECLIFLEIFLSFDFCSGASPFSAVVCVCVACISSCFQVGFCFLSSGFWLVTTLLHFIFIFYFIRYSFFSQFSAISLIWTFILSFDCSAVLVYTKSHKFVCDSKNCCSEQNRCKAKYTHLDMFYQWKQIVFPLLYTAFYGVKFSISLALSLSLCFSFFFLLIFFSIPFFIYIIFVGKQANISIEFIYT